MLTHRVQQAVDANANDILDFLERNAQSIHSNKQELGESTGTASEFYIEVGRKNHTISIYVKPLASRRHREEIIRFEVIENPIHTSLINAVYDSSTRQFILLFYRIWTRLAIAFGAPFAGEAFKKLNELEQAGLL